MQFHFPHYLYEMKPCFLKDISVDYHPAGTPSYAIDNEGDAPAPTGMSVTLSFQETSIITRTDIMEKNF
jgi:hypothetical protein